MISPVAMAMATITVMLWIMWSDTIRARRPSQILYAVRIALYLIVSGILVLNMIRYPHLFPGTSRVLCIVAVLVGISGAAYFARRLILRR
jgi:phosphatidylserine synthase